MHAAHLQHIFQGLILRSDDHIRRYHSDAFVGKYVLLSENTSDPALTVSDGQFVGHYVMSIIPCHHFGLEQCAVKICAMLSL
jgi:hypothetical protein